MKLKPGTILAEKIGGDICLNKHMLIVIGQKEMKPYGTATFNTRKEATIYICYYVSDGRLGIVALYILRRYYQPLTMVFYDSREKRKKQVIVLQ